MELVLYSGDQAESLPPWNRRQDQNKTISPTLDPSLPHNFRNLVVVNMVVLGIILTDPEEPGRGQTGVIYDQDAGSKTKQSNKESSTHQKVSDRNPNFKQL